MNIITANPIDDDKSINFDTKPINRPIPPKS